jgi:hypothetical protein
MGSRAREFHPRFEVLVSEVGAPKPEPRHTGEEAKPPFAVPSNGFAIFLRFRLGGVAPARRRLRARDTLRCGRRDGLSVGLVRAMAGR